MTEKYNNAISRWVCSTECPCWEGENKSIENTWKDYKDKKDNFYKEAGRSWKKEESNPIIWSATQEGTYKTFQECYNGVIKDSPDSKWDLVKTYIGNSGYKFIAETEERLSCAGICEPGLFYIATDVAKGKPEKDCFNALIDDL